MMSKFSSRKLIGSAVLYLTATVALFTKIADFGAWAQFMTFVAGLYFASNVADKVAESRAGGPDGSQK